MINVHMSVEELTQRLVQFDTINPPGNEAECIRFAADFLERVGFLCELIEHEQGRASLIATRDLGGGLPICFSGHLDTVPLGLAPWSVDPFAGEMHGDRLYGRGSSDMKGGVAAFLHAVSRVGKVKGGIIVILTAGEETGCDGARWLVKENALPEVGAMIVGESTDNQVFYGHKGVLWMRAKCLGKAAHGATPELGENAIKKAIPLLAKLAAFDPGGSHAAMGQATANLGTIHGGININSVPDICEVTIDIRSVPGMSHKDLQQEIDVLVEGIGEAETVLDLPPVWTDPKCPWCVRVEKNVTNLTGVRQQSAAVKYFTDAALLKQALGNPPTIILGPGSLDQPHTTDEYVSIANLQEAASLYHSLLEDWDAYALT